MTCLYKPSNFPKKEIWFQSGFLTFLVSIKISFFGKWVHWWLMSAIKIAFFGNDFLKRQFCIPRYSKKLCFFCMLFMFFLYAFYVFFVCFLCFFCMLFMFFLYVFYVFFVCFLCFFFVCFLCFFLCFLCMLPMFSRTLLCFFCMFLCMLSMFFYMFFISLLGKSHDQPSLYQPTGHPYPQFLPNWACPRYWYQPPPASNGPVEKPL